jgi:NADH dehydrogenase
VRGEPLDVTVVDRVNHHLFQPLLYQVTTAGLAAPAIAAPSGIFSPDRRVSRLLVTCIASMRRVAP